MKTIKDFDLKNKRVIIRVDFNVPIKNGVITDDNRIKESLDTINYAVNNEARVILLSHLGRVKETADLAKNDLSPVFDYLRDKTTLKVHFSSETRGHKLEELVNELKPGEVLLVQNTRYEDLDGNKESSNDPELAKYWASLGDIFINDAFATAHRAHASNVGIGSILPSGVGFLIQKELDNMLPVINNPIKPFTVILGGSKVSDKIGLIANLIDKVDYLLVGGGMAYTFLKSQNKEIGQSLLEEEYLEYCRDLLNKYPNKIILPVDNYCAKEIGQEGLIKEEMDSTDIGLDIGPKTINIFKEYLVKSKTIIWNGPLGVFENPLYANGTKEISSSFNKNNQTIIVGGGDTASAVINLGYKDLVTHISTGGGASLELLEGKDLPGISIIK